VVVGAIDGAEDKDGGYSKLINRAKQKISNIFG
jgi:hypothetical protein